MMSKLEKHLGSWAQFTPLCDVLENEVLPKLAKHKHEVIYPEADNIFKAFRMCPASRLKVVILGQDPYHTPGMATGLCFDNPVGVKKMSPSLQNILKKISFEPVDVSMEGMEAHGSYLGHLPGQGVLMANTALTVQHSKPGSHAKIWEPWTITLMKILNQIDNIVWLVWGAHALKYASMVTNSTHTKIISSHPSPLSVRREMGEYDSFNDTAMFAAVNEILKSKNKIPIVW